MNTDHDRTSTADDLSAATVPTFYFIGVTTGGSSIRRVFPLWAAELGLGDVVLAGIDLPVHAPAEDYRRVVEFIKHDPLSLGALVTTHKLDLFRAAADVFDEVDPLAELMHEVSSISKRDGRLVAHAKDPISSGLALDAFVPPGHFATSGAELVVFGAGGSAIAIDWYLTRTGRGADVPSRVVVTNRDDQRLEALRAVHEASGAQVVLDTRRADDPSVNDAVLAAAPVGSVVINATGLGKDAPGSPISADAPFPGHALVWDLNYRGDLVFLDQARAQESQRGLHVEDGWTYFVHGWTQVIAEVFDVTIPTSGPGFDRLSDLAASTRS